VRKAAPTAGYIHFATHGFINNSFNGEYSGLVTADAPIFILDIFNMALNSRIVVLSACETGLGKLSEGDELVSLSRAFMQAGADNLAATLWKVEDRTTRDIMIAFYKNLLQGRTPQESLRQAQLEVMKKRPNPFLWGPFIIYGKGM